MKLLMLIQDPQILNTGGQEDWVERVTQGANDQFQCMVGFHTFLGHQLGALQFNSVMILYVGIASDPTD